MSLVAWLTWLTVSTSPPEVALVVTQPWASESSLHFVHASDTTLPKPLVRFTHEPDAEVKSVVLPGQRRVLAVVQLFPAKDESWASGLLRLSENEAPVMLADRVYHATRPWVTPQGRVFVQRGMAGPEPTEADALAGKLRTDVLTVEEINPLTGQAHVVHATTGYVAFIAGSVGEELLLYRVRAEGADLVAVNMNNKNVRELMSSLVPMARDFQVDEQNNALWLTQADIPSSQFSVWKIDVRSGERQKKATGRLPSLSPSRWPGQDFVYNPDGRGWTLSSGQPLAPLGRGIDSVRAFSADEAWVLGVHAKESDFFKPFVMRVGQREPQTWVLPVPTGLRSDVAGFVEGVSK